MAYLDTGGALTLPGITGSAEAFIVDYTVVHEGPTSGNAVPALLVPLTVTIQHGVGADADLQMQVSSDASFAAVDWSTELVAIEDGTRTVSAGPLVDGATYYWRVRVAETGTGSWDAWTEPWIFRVDTGSGRGYGYVDLNQGTELIPVSDIVEFVNVNVGVELPYFVDSTGLHFASENVGFEVILDPGAYGYVHEGDVNTLTPTPHLWFLQPGSGRPGDGIRIFCLGVGDLQSTFNGKVDAYFGPQQGWVSLPVIGWQTQLPTPEAYGPDRVLNPVTQEIDMQHTIIEISIPATALPPGYPIRLRTDGP